MKYAHQYLVTTVSLIAISAMLTVPVPAGAGEIHGNQTGQNVSLGAGSFASNTSGKHNTALGHRALRLNTTGKKNTALGRIALRHNDRGSFNTAVGSEALWKNTRGSFNTASGFSALNKNQTGNFNTASGSSALNKNQTGNFNTASGSGALDNNTVGNSNTASGIGVLGKNQTGNSNTASGAHALYSNINGDENTVLGFAALRNNRNGFRNTVLGSRAGASSTTGSNNVYIGYRAGDNTTYANRSNKLVIANGNTLNDELISGSFSEQVVDINGQLNVQGQLTTVSMNIDGLLNAQSVAMTSDARLKKDIQPLTRALDSILQLQAKTYRWKEDTTFANKQDIGLVAQEVEKVFPELVAENEQGYKGIAYSKLTAVLIEAIKEQQEAFTRDVSDLEDAITVLEAENAQLKAMMSNDIEALLARVAVLEGIPLAQH